jgi:hypothetical protein|tara:strand:+ start:165 stop:395 length:231 start_codon:yes stop_codon:yes gene_type:complete
MEAENEFVNFLKNEVGLPDDTISKLIDAGFDDMESLELSDVNSLKIVGIKDAEIVHKKIAKAIDAEPGRMSDLQLD